MKHIAVWLVRKLDPGALVLWGLDSEEYRTIRDYMILRNHKKAWEGKI